MEIEVKNFQEPEKETQSNSKAYLYSVLSCLFFGISNFCQSDISIRVGIIGIFPQVPGLIVIWALFHLYHGIKKTSGQYYESVEHEQLPEESSANIKAEKVVSKITLRRLSAPLGRMLFILLIHVTHIATFLFAAKSNINGGIISTIFSSSCVFTSIIFYFKHGQKMTKSDFLGTFFIMGCVGLISLGGSNQSGEVDRLYLALALVMAILTGLNLSLNTLNTQYVFSTGFDIDQSNYDGAALVGLLYLPFFFWYR